MNQPASDEHGFAPTFYRLPARLLETGMSTDDGQDVFDVVIEDGAVYASVYTPRTDDPEADAKNRAELEWRIYEPVDVLVDLGVFVDTLVDGSGYPGAVRESGATRGAS